MSGPIAHAGRVATAQLLSDGEYAVRSLGYVWDPVLLDYVVATPAAGGGGGGGGPVSIANGQDVAEGATTDAEAAAGNGSVIALLKRLRTLLSGALAVNVSDGSGNALASTTDPTSLVGTERALIVTPAFNSTWDTKISAAVATFPSFGVDWDTSDRDVRLLGRVKNLDSAGAVIDPATKQQLPAALTAAGNLKVSLQEDGGAVIGVDDNAGSLTVDAPVATPLFARLSDGAAALIGQKPMASSLPVSIASDQGAVPVSLAAAAVIFKGRSSTFRTLGRAGTAGQKILSIFNAAGSPVKVTVSAVAVDLLQTVIKAITVIPPVVRLYKVVVLPTNGTALTKNKTGGSGASSASVTVLGDASADGTGSGTTLTATLPAGAIVTEEFAPRFITAAGYEPADRIEFLGDASTIDLAAGEGLVLMLDYTTTAANPITDNWVGIIEWTEN